MDALAAKKRIHFGIAVQRCIARPVVAASGPGTADYSAWSRCFRRFVSLWVSTIVQAATPRATRAITTV